ncbi:MAG: hypothetical protein K2H30_06720 [Clostridia bacterium]|nr:hypothetical protein [Clostridia bacterium]
MEFDIITLTPEELKALTAVQMKMLRTAQQKKDALYRTAEKEYATFKNIVMTNGMLESTLLEAKQAEIDRELGYQCALLADNLIYNMSLNEPYPDDSESGDESAGYIVDYSLPYTDRYVIVRDYYLAIADGDERMALYNADDVARAYLGAYYTTLYDVLAVYSK